MNPLRDTMEVGPTSALLERSTADVAHAHPQFGLGVGEHVCVLFGAARRAGLRREGAGDLGGMFCSGMVSQAQG
jgi:hypothetical protein